MCVDVHVIICFVCCEVDPVPYSTKQNPLIYPSSPISFKEIELFTTLNSFAGAVKTYKLTRVHDSGGGKFMHYLS